MTPQTTVQLQALRSLLSLPILQSIMSHNPYSLIHTKKSCVMRYRLTQDFFSIHFPLPLSTRQYFFTGFQKREISFPGHQQNPASRTASVTNFAGNRRRSPASILRPAGRFACPAGYSGLSGAITPGANKPRQRPFSRLTGQGRAAALPLCYPRLCSARSYRAHAGAFCGKPSSRPWPMNPTQRQVQPA